MSCYYPIPAYRIADRDGRNPTVVFAATRGMNVIGEFHVPCGQCIGCKLERTRQWAVRCMHEASLYERNCFITLTYNEDHFPIDGGLHYEDFQLFMKRLRKKFAYHVKTKRHQGPFRKIRYFMCGEYGENFRRPHFHACIFNFDFDDRVYFKTTQSGSKIYTSVSLQDLWSDPSNNPIGFVTVGDVNFNSAGYVARYLMEKHQEKDDDMYKFVDFETGEVSYRAREFNRMSLKPGIGEGFYRKFKRDMFPHDICVVNGKAMKPPKYYTKKLATDDDDCYNLIQLKRHEEGRALAHDNVEERLRVKEVCAKARTTLLKREIT